MPGPAFLAGDRLTLRAVVPEDYPFLVEHWNRPSVRRFTDVHDPMTAGDVATVVEDHADAAFLSCFDGDPVGYAWAYDADDVDGHASIGYWIAEPERGQGYATETVALVAEWAFRDRQLHKLLAHVFDPNGASMRVLEKAGFRREGTLREQYRVEGEFVDAAVYGLLEGEWEPR